MHFRSDEQNFLVLTGADPGVRDREAVDKSAALIAYVDGGNVGEAELALQKDAVAGLEVIRRAGAVDDAVDVLRFEAGFVERLFRCDAREADAGVPAIDPVARLDAATLDDPLIRRVHDLREIVVGDETRGDVKASGQKCGTRHRSSDQVASDLRGTQD